MVQTSRPVAPYIAPLHTRVLEGFWYGGGIGQWAWVLHRITGLGIAFFLVIHILDTFIVVSYPEFYDHTVSIYGGVVAGTPYIWLRWAFRIGEMGLIASVLFHAINGLRIVLFDFWPATVRLQKELAWAVLTVFIVVLVPVAVVVLYPLSQASDHWKVPSAEVKGPAMVSTPGPVSQR